MKDFAAFLTNKMTMTTFFLGINCLSVTKIRMELVFVFEIMKKTVNRGNAKFRIFFSQAGEKFFSSEKSIKGFNLRKN